MKLLATVVGLVALGVMLAVLCIEYPSTRRAPAAPPPPHLTAWMDSTHHVLCYYFLPLGREYPLSCLPYTIVPSPKSTPNASPKATARRDRATRA